MLGEEAACGSLACLCRRLLTCELDNDGLLKPAEIWIQDSNTCIASCWLHTFRMPRSPNTHCVMADAKASLPDGAFLQTMTQAHTVMARQPYPRRVRGPRCHSKLIRECRDGSTSTAQMLHPCCTDFDSSRYGSCSCRCFEKCLLRTGKGYKSTRSK